MADKNKKVHNFLRCPHCGAWLDKTEEKCPECFTNLKKLSRIPFKRIWHSLRIPAFILIVIVVIHLASYALIYQDASSSGINIKAKAYFSAASVVTIVEVCPLEQVFGFDNALALPFKTLRDWFFQKGEDSLPNDDGERYIWWFMIYYQEYEKTVKYEIKKYLKCIEEKQALSYDKSKIPKLYEWTDKLLNVLEPLATSKIRDKSFRKKRLNFFNGIALSFYNDKGLLLLAKEKSTVKKDPYYETEEDINDLKYIHKLYSELTAYTLRKEKESYNYFFNETNRHMYHYALMLLISKDILLYSEVHNEKITCDNEYLISYGKNYGGLIEKYYNTNDPISRVDSNNLGWILTYYPPQMGRWVKMSCSNSDMNFFNEYMKKKLIKDIGKEWFDNLDVNKREK